MTNFVQFDLEYTVGDEFSDAAAALSAFDWTAAVETVRGFFPEVSTLKELKPALLDAPDDACAVLACAVFGSFFERAVVGPAPELDTASARLIAGECPGPDDLVTVLVGKAAGTPAAAIELALAAADAAGAAHLAARAAVYAAREAEALPNADPEELEAAREAAADRYAALTFAPGSGALLREQSPAALLEAGHALSSLGDPRAEDVLEAALAAVGVKVELVAATHVAAAGSPRAGERRSGLGVALKLSGPAAAETSALPPRLAVAPLFTSSEGAPLWEPEVPEDEPQLGALGLAGLAAARELFAFRNPPSTESGLVRRQLRAFDECIARHRGVSVPAALASAVHNALFFAEQGQDHSADGAVDAGQIASVQFVNALALPEMAFELEDGSPADRRACFGDAAFAQPGVWYTRTRVARLAAGPFMAAGFVQNAADAFALANDVARAAEALLLGNKREEALAIAKAGVRAQDPVSACIVAEAENDSSYFEKAWAWSGHRLARARRGQARAALDANDLAQAIRLFKEALSADPAHGQTWFGLGTAYRRLGAKWARPAAEAFRRATETMDAPADAYANLGTAEAALGDFAAAASAFRSSLALSNAQKHVWGFLLLSLAHGALWPELARALHDAARALQGFFDPATGRPRLCALLDEHSALAVAAARAAADGAAPAKPVFDALTIAHKLYVSEAKPTQAGQRATRAPACPQWLVDARSMAKRAM